MWCLYIGACWGSPVPGFSDWHQALLVWSCMHNCRQCQPEDWVTKRICHGVSYPPKGLSIFSVSVIEPRLDYDAVITWPAVSHKDRDKVPLPLSIRNLCSCGAWPWHDVYSLLHSAAVQAGEPQSQSSFYICLLLPRKQYSNWAALHSGTLLFYTIFKSFNSWFSIRPCCCPEI